MTPEHKEEFKRLREDVTTIMTNHLPHIQILMQSLNDRVKLLMWVLGIVGSTIIIGLVGAILALILKQ